MEIKFKRLQDNAVMPTKAHATDAGCDLTAANFGTDLDGNFVYGAGIAVEIPTGFVGLVFPRSSVAGVGLQLTNCVGVIDSGYRGEVKMKFRPHGRGVCNPYKVGDRIGQLIVMPYPEVTFTEVEQLSDSERGEGGYGSSGR